MRNFEEEKESKQVRGMCSAWERERGMREMSKRNNGNLQQLRNGAINNTYLIHGDN